jgi:peptidoglycan/xylan/chitin deacetylase (PgdA/CDA1 family)
MEIASGRQWSPAWVLPCVLPPQFHILWSAEWAQASQQQPQARLGTKGAATFSAIQWWPRLWLLLLLVALAGCGSSAANRTTPNPIALAEPPTATVTATPTPTPTATPTVRTRIPTPTATPTVTPTPDIRQLLQSPLPTPARRFVRQPTLGVTVPPLTTTWPSAPALFTPVPDLGATISLRRLAASTLQPTPDGVKRTANVPILMDHYLETPPADADIYRRDLSVSPERFEEHLSRLKREGYTTITLYDLLAYLTQGAPLPPKPVILTFDDGYRDQYENAFPLLLKYGMTATFFIVTDFIDEERPDYVTWPMVREMYAAGMSIESHGRNHVSLRGKDNDYLVWQALGSLETIEFELGVRPRFVSYPAGEYNQATIDIFHSANYWAGLTTVQGATHSSDDLFELRRVRIRGTTTADELARLLALDW